MTPNADTQFMQRAVELAASRLGETVPNPSVGCVIVAAGEIVGEAATAPGGRPHAETQALALAGLRASGASVYVTLEPCAHHGQTPPCADALVAARVERVVIACLDEDHRVRGRGADRLRNAGIEVETGLLGADAEALYAGFFHRLRTGLPLVYADARPGGYDASLDIDDADAISHELERLGALGMSRVRIAPEHRLLPELKRRGYVKEIPSHTTER